MIAYVSAQHLLLILQELPFGYLVVARRYLAVKASIQLFLLPKERELTLFSFPSLPLCGAEGVVVRSEEEAAVLVNRVERSRLDKALKRFLVSRRRWHALAEIEEVLEWPARFTAGDYLFHHPGAHVPHRGKAEEYMLVVGCEGRIAQVYVRGFDLYAHAACLVQVLDQPVLVVHVSGHQSGHVL